jgi:hypothetical protein
MSLPPKNVPPLTFPVVIYETYISPASVTAIEGAVSSPFVFTPEFSRIHSKFTISTPLSIRPALLTPTALVARTSNEYAVPFVRPVTIIGEAALVTTSPKLDVTVYIVISDPPFDAGAANDTIACELPTIADTSVGASETVHGVTIADTLDTPPIPATLVAVTVNVYSRPFTRP